MVSVSTNWLNTWNTVFGNNTESKDYSYPVKEISSAKIISDFFGLKAIVMFANPEGGAWRIPFRGMRALGTGVANSVRLITEFLPLWASKYFSNLYNPDRIKNTDQTLHTANSEFSETPPELPNETTAKKTLIETIKQEASNLIGGFFFGLYLTGRAITSPRVSLQKAWSHGKANGGIPYAVFLTALSFMLTTVVYTMMLPFVIKGFAIVLLPSVAISAVNSFAIFLASQSTVFVQVGNLISNVFIPFNGLGITPTLWLYAGVTAAALNLGFLFERAYKIIKGNGGVKSYNHFSDYESNPQVEAEKFESEQELFVEKTPGIREFLSQTKDSIVNFFGSIFSSRAPQPASRVESLEKDRFINQDGHQSTVVIVQNTNYYTASSQDVSLQQPPQLLVPPSYAPPIPEEYKRAHAHTTYGNNTLPHQYDDSYEQPQENYHEFTEIEHHEDQGQPTSHYSETQNNEFGENTYYGEQPKDAQTYIKLMEEESADANQKIADLTKQLDQADQGGRVKPSAPSRPAIPQAWEEDIYQSDYKSHTPS